MTHRGGGGERLYLRKAEDGVEMGVLRFQARCSLTDKALCVAR